MDFRTEPMPAGPRWGSGSYFKLRRFRMSRYLFAFLILPALGQAQISDYTINTVMGSSTATVLGDAGPANAAQLSNPIGLWFDSSHNLYIADSGFNRVREVTG